MKKAVLLLMLAAAFCRLKAQQATPRALLITPGISGDNLFKPLKPPGSGLFKFQPDIKQVLPENITGGEPFYSNMPVKVLEGDSKMPVKKIGGYYTMPVKRIGTEDGGGMPLNALPGQPTFIVPVK